MNKKNPKFNSIPESEKIAKNKIRKGAFNWLISGAEDNHTTDQNINFLKQIKILPKILSKNYKLTLRSNFLNDIIETPLLLSPMGHQAQFHKQGEIEMAKGISECNTIGFFSTQSRYTLEEIRKKNLNTKIVWQIFPFGNKEWITKEIKRAEKCGCKAIALCLDAPVRSHRYIDRETNYDARKYGKMRKLSQNPSFALRFDWNLIKWIKKKTKKQIILKGIINPKDALLAKKNNIKILWISNHGGRMFNSGISTGEALLEIRKKVGKKMILIADGGIRKGTDIIKYLALGANFVGIGRPAIYGLIIDGSKGVKLVFDLLNSELRSAMLNGGFKNLKELNLSRIYTDHK